MDALDYWRLCDELSVVQAALLILGIDPAEMQEYIDGYSSQNRPKGYDALMAALGNAIMGRRLPAKLGYTDYSEEQISWHATSIKVDDLRKWLSSRGVSSGFFFPNEAAGPDFLAISHPNYSSKLAAAIKAWSA